MDWIDFLFKFSGELLVLGLAVLVTAGNIYFFSGSTKHAYNDQSLLAQLLNNHPDKNKSLFVKNSTIITSLINGGLFTQAHADDFEGLSSQDQTNEQATTADSSFTQIDANGILKPNPDSIDSFMLRQIKVYTIQKGDTLKSIAAKNGISEQTIMWANNLPNDTVKPSWTLIILPTDGILHKMTSNDTLPDLAQKYSGNIDTIISYNALKDAEDFNVDDLIIVPGGIMPAPPKPKPTPKPVPKTTSSKVKASNSVISSEPIAALSAGSHLFPWGYCTWYVATKVKITWGGNAKTWLTNARAMGYLVNRNPAPGSILVTTESPRFGHVAYVESVGENSITVSEMNYERFGKVDTREIPLGSGVIKGFIHP